MKDFYEESVGKIFIFFSGGFSLLLWVFGISLLVFSWLFGFSFGFLPVDFYYYSGEGEEWFFQDFFFVVWGIGKRGNETIKRDTWWFFRELLLFPNNQNFGGSVFLVSLWWNLSVDFPHQQMLFTRCQNIEW